MEINNAIGPALRTLAQLTPFSACIAAAWNEYESKKINDRLEYLFKVLNNEIKLYDSRFIELQDQISKGKYTAQYVETIARNIVQESSEIKQTLYGLLLSNCLIDSEANYEEKLNAIGTLDTLYESDIQLLRSISRKGSTRVEDLYSYTGNNNELGQVIAILSKLESRGLIGESDSGDKPPINVWVGNQSHRQNRWNNKYFSILPFGSRFLSLISSNDEKTGKEKDGFEISKY